MKRLLVLSFYGLLPHFVGAQSTTGITGKPDTSYTIHSAYKGTLRTHPDAKWVGEFNLATIKEKRNITYCEMGSRPLKLDVFYPLKKATKPRIAIIIIHGGGWRTGDRSLHYPMAQRLADLGYVCITPGYRLSTEALYPAAVYDLKSALRWVKKNAKEFNIDTTKVAVAGHSAGGELSAMMGTTNDIAEFEGVGCLNNTSTVQAVINMDGILAFIHPESGEGDDSKRTSAATYWFGYSKGENPGLWQKGSPLTYAGKNTPPTLFINSAVDRMHAGRKDYIAILNSHNIYSEVKTFEGAPHSFCLFEPWFEPTIKYMDEFLKKIFNQ
jgi:pectinesterase